MADQNKPTPEPNPTAETGTPTSNGEGSRGPRPAVQDTGEGYPHVDTLSYDPEDGDWVGQTRRWIEENPGLALAGAAVAGLAIGRLVAAAIPERRPETPQEKIERRARLAAEHGREFAEDAGEVISKQLAIAADALGEASKAVAQGAKKGYGEAKDLSEFLAETIGEAISKKAAHWLNR